MLLSASANVAGGVGEGARLRNCICHSLSFFAVKISLGAKFCDFPLVMFVLLDQCERLRGLLR